MLSTLKKYLVGFWVLALLGSTVGISLQQVYCYCVGETTVSLFEAEDACHMEDYAAIMDDCCKKPEKQPESSCCEREEKEKDGCTKKTTVVFKLKSEYEVNYHDFKKLDAGKHLLQLVLPTPVVAWTNAAQKLPSSRFDRPPPPLSGRMMCVRNGVFRC